MRFLSDSRAHNEVFRCATRAYASRCSTVQSPFNVMQATVSRIWLLQRDRILATRSVFRDSSYPVIYDCHPGKTMNP
jgi:hypothetical protein